MSRIDDLVIEKQVVVGHLARRLAKPTEVKTHHWEIFLYSPTGEDLTKWIDRCVFHLHESFEQPERTLTREPYIVAEDGWGEFEAQIEIVPKCAISFTLIHVITFPAKTSVKPALIVRRQEAVIFRNPPPLLYEGLTAASFTWNRFKKMKRQPKAADAEYIDEPSSDFQLEKKWLSTVSDVSRDIRSEIQNLEVRHREHLDKISVLLEQIRRTSPDIAEAASLFL
ncbi:YEATS family protein [Tritrichomonas foetus]|uniref:YEATS family protein n=1 Tax=Tritrichomonas foetus TaxID=1144522 RepID=A0A1J4KE68_9EUKA|nr:YEATS family protein [Tritrichomonas foetus]|eukprot:OHT09727.1 YEATS family protein [Tritrichomonas foetus]